MEYTTFELNRRFRNYIFETIKPNMAYKLTSTMSSIIGSRNVLLYHITVLSLVAFTVLFYLHLTFPNDIRAQGASITAADIRIAAVGDWACNPNTMNTLKNLESKHPDLVLALGDLSYQTTANCWLNLISPIENKTKIAIGNHDVITQQLLAQYMNHFGLSKQYYSFNFQNIHFLVMSTEVFFPMGSPEYNFVNNDLKAASTNPSIKWIIVSYHRPTYTSPSVHPGIVLWRETYHPLFDQYHVDLVLQGHNHNYQRSYPIEFNSSNTESPIITSTQKNSYDKPKGEIYTIVGTGGQFPHQLQGQAPYVVTQTSNIFGFLEIDISGHDLKGIYFANNGTIKDQFTITK
jgi:predicted phosphodiesterase